MSLETVLELESEPSSFVRKFQVNFFVAKILTLTRSKVCYGPFESCLSTPANRHKNDPPKLFQFHSQTEVREK